MSDYAESFLAYADDQGHVDLDIAAQLLDEHDTNFDNIIADGYDEALTDGEALLHWIGY